MDGKIYYLDSTVKIIKDTRTPEEKEASRVKARQSIEDWYNLPENAEAKKRRYVLRDTIDRLDAEKKANDEYWAKREAEREAEPKKTDWLLVLMVIFFPITIVVFGLSLFVEDVREDGFFKTMEGIFKALPYILFPPLIFLELFGALYGE